MTTRQVEWHFNPPGAPHFGGAWESLVKSAKRALTRILGQRTLTDEILTTALCIAENLLNGRPLTYLTDEATEAEVLTPNHLLTGRANPNLPADLFCEKDFNFKKRWRYAEALATEFWRRWMREYLPTMAERKKWFGTQANLCIGDLVVILDPNTQETQRTTHKDTGKWPLGRITKVVPDKHGIVRSAFVKVGNAELHRPAVKLCPLTEEL